MRNAKTGCRFSNELLRTVCKGTDIECFSVNPEFGIGFVRSFQVMPGVQLIYSQLELQAPVTRPYQLRSNMVELSFCLDGEVCIDASEIKIGSGDIVILNHTHNYARFDFRGCPFLGVSMVIFLPEIVTTLNIMLGTLSFEEDEHLYKLFLQEPGLVIGAQGRIAQAFYELRDLPEKYNNYLTRLKTMELLLYIMGELK